MQLLVGLGNPGPQHEKTRHNAGFWFLDEVAKKFDAILHPEKKFSARHATITVDDGSIHLLKPQTFMNESGRSVAAVAGYFNIAPQDILVVHDEIDLPAGVAKYKQGGGHGGHNGLRSIFEYFSSEFWRLRIGVGHPGSKHEVIDFVLKAPSKTERELIDASIERALTTINDVIAGDMHAAMMKLHSKEQVSGI